MMTLLFLVGVCLGHALRWLDNLDLRRRLAAAEQLAEWRGKLLARRDAEMAAAREAAEALGRLCECHKRRYGRGEGDGGDGVGGGGVDSSGEIKLELFPDEWGDGEDYGHGGGGGKAGA
jgi:hypothetical protein